jgi:hypothetical protein
MAQPNHSKEIKTAVSGALGALSVCPASLIPTSSPDACQAIQMQTEPGAGLAIHSGGASNQIDRRSPMLREQLRTSTAAPVINFVTPSARKLSDLIAAFEAAERHLSVVCEIEDQYPCRKRPKVLGGVTAASTLVIEGRPDAHCPASEWFYHSIEAIERDYSICTKRAETPGERAKVEERFAALRAEYTRQQDEIERAVPKSQRQAERKLKAAHRTVSARERKILSYKPADLGEAVTLLEFVSGGKRRSCFSSDEDDLHTIMLNVADAIRRAV